MPRPKSVAVLGEGQRQRQRPEAPKGLMTATFHKDVNPTQISEFLDRHPTAEVSKELSTHSADVYVFPESEYRREMRENEERATAMVGSPADVPGLTEDRVHTSSATLEAHMAQSEADAAATAARMKELESTANPFESS